MGVVLFKAESVLLARVSIMDAWEKELQQKFCVAADNYSYKPSSDFRGCAMF